jgi:sigma-E factor negative regulatory protein RseC
MEKSIEQQELSIELGEQRRSSVGQNQKITHQGVIEAVEGNHVRVNIVQVAACNSCKARSLCASSESKEKIIDVYEQGAEKKYKSGDQVTVCGALSMGKQAVRLAFAIPLLLIVIWMVVSMAFLQMSELTSVGILAAILFVYFYVLYQNREEMAKRFAFWIE